MFGTRLQTLRKSRKLTLEQLASTVGTTKSYIWELENKPNIQPSAALVTRLANALDCTVEYLMEGESSDEDQVFFREYQQLDDDVKSTLTKIMKSLKHRDGD